MWRDKIKADSVAALKAGDHRLVGVLRYLLSILDKRALQLPVDKMSDTEEVAVLRKELKNKEEAKAMFLQAGRTDLVEQEDLEIEVLRKYLPPEMAVSEIEAVVEKVIEEKGKVFGVVMGESMQRLGGKVGGEVVAKIVKEKLA